MGDDYYDGVQKRIDVICERFTIEHISYDNSINVLNVWIFNYGNAGIDIMYGNLNINIELASFYDT